MKRFFKSMLVVVATITAVMTLSSFAPQQDDDSDVKAILKEAIAEVNAECPMDMGDGMSMQATYILNNRMIFDFRAPKDVVDGFEMMMDWDAAGTKKMMAVSMLTGGDEVVFLFMLCEMVDYSIEFRFSEKDSAKSISLILSSKELADILEEKYSKEDLETIVIDLLEAYME